MSFIDRQNLAAHLEHLGGAIRKILAIQQTDGSIPWFEDGPWDPWNHIECAMALDAAGAHAAARAAYSSLMSRQNTDGSWLGEYGNTLPMSDRNHIARQQAPEFRDTNFSAYCATGLLHHHLTNRDRTFAHKHWTAIDRAMQFCLSLQHDNGDISWSAEAFDTDTDDSLIAGNASIAKSLACAIQLGMELGQPVAHLEAGRGQLVEAIKLRPNRFDRKGTGARYAMDWYYPVLAGIFPITEGKQRLSARWDEFVVQGLGCLCVSDQPWATVAETCELVMALLVSGKKEIAGELLTSQLMHRDENGAFWMGWQFEEQVFWPLEQPSWTQAAVVLATDAFYGKTDASQLLVSGTWR